jgi:predicted alpha/beta superfamily hydrolase
MQPSDLDTPAREGPAGDIRRMAGLRSPELDNTRDVEIYVPPSYRTSGRHYPVVYMHDGQNLFDPRTSFAGEWQVDETMERLAPEGVEAIVVAIPNMGPRRIDEYSPFRDPKNGGGRGEAYLAFIIDTLKPRIDRRFRTKPEREHTGLVGSSMGGLISLYGFLRHPQVFGFAGAMSPSLWFADRAVLEFARQAPRWTGRLYLDVGTEEGARTVRNTRAAARLLQRKAVRGRGRVLYVEERGARHHESAWAARFEHAIRFLLPRRRGDVNW